MDSKELTQKAVSGTKWTTISTASVIILQTVQWMILARLLKVNEIGVMTKVTVILGFASIFADMGVSSAIIYRQDTNKEQLSSLYWLNIGSGVLVFLVVCALTPLLSILNEIPAAPILLIAVILPVTTVGQQFQFLMQKELMFNRLAIIEMISAAAGFIVAVVCALLNKGVYSIIWAQIILAAVKSVMLLTFGIKRWPLILRFKRKDLDGYVSFGVFQMGEKLVNYLNSNIDYMLIGRLLGNEALGYYSIAYNLIVKPVSYINPIVNRVAFPVFSKMQNDLKGLKKIYITVIRLLSIINFPLLSGLFITAPTLIPLMYSDKYLPSVLLVQILSGVGLMRCICNPIGSLQLARGRADMGFYWNFGVMLVQIPGIYIGIHLAGVKGVALIYLAISVLQTFVMYFVLIKRLVGNCFKEYFASMWTPLWLSAVMCVCVYLVTLLFEKSVSKYIIIIQIVVGMVSYIGLAYISNKSMVSSVLNVVLKKKTDFNL